MTHFTKEASGIYRITDEHLTCSIALSAEEAYSLLEWLYQRRDDIYTDSHRIDAMTVPPMTTAEVVALEQEEAKQPTQICDLRTRYVCDRCSKFVEEVFDLTPASMGDTMTIYVCDDCHDATARELEADGYNLDL